MVAKAHRPSSSESDDWGDEGWIVDCPCGINYDDGEKMVECDECGVWVHTACCRVVKDQETFNCDKCKSKKRKEVEESEVAQLLVDLPSKTLSFEERGHEKTAAAHVDPVRSPVATSFADRAHVHGVPGGDPRLFLAGSIFSQQLWKYAGYVRKPLRIDFEELPLDSGEHDIFQMLEDPQTDELALVVTLDSARLEHGRAEAKSSPDGATREAPNGDLAPPKDKIAKTEIRRGERPGKHKLKLKLKHRHKSHKEDRLRHHEKRPKDAGGVQDSASKKKLKCSGGDAANAGDERSKKVEGLFRNANVSPTNLEGSVREVKASVKKGEDSPQAANFKREGSSFEAIVSFKSPQSSPKNPKAMKKLAVQEFMDGGVTICSKCCREEPILGRPLTISGGKAETKCCKGCGNDLEKLQRTSTSDGDALVPPRDVKGCEETADLPSPIVGEPGLEGKHSSTVEGPETGDRRVDVESLRTDHSHRALPSDLKDHQSIPKRHGGLRLFEKAEARIVNQGPGVSEQHFSAVDTKSVAPTWTKEAGGKVVRFDKEQKMLSPGVSEDIMLSGKETLTAHALPKSGRYVLKGATCGDSLVHSHIKPSASIRSVKADDSSENCDLDMKVGDMPPLQHSASGRSDGENSAPGPSIAPPVTGEMSEDASHENIVRTGDGFTRHTPMDAVLTQAPTSPRAHYAQNDILTGVPSSDVLLQKKSSEGGLDAASGKYPSRAQPSFSNTDGGDVRIINQLSAGIREKGVERPGINRLSAAGSHQDSAQPAQVSSISVEMAHKGTQSLGTEHSMRSPRTGTTQESVSAGKQYPLGAHQQVGSSKHVSTPKQQQKHQDISTPLSRVETEHSRVRQLGISDQAEVAESLASSSLIKQAEQGPAVDVLDHKVSPLQSPLCQQARQHHLHSGRGRPGSSSSAAISSGGTHRNPSPTTLGASKSTTPGGSKSSGGSSSVSPKSPPVPPQFPKHGGSKSNPTSPTPPQRPSVVPPAKPSHASSKQSPTPAPNSKHQSPGAKQSLVSSSSLPSKTPSSSKQPSRTNSLPSLKGVDNSLPPKSPGAAIPTLRGSNLGSLNAATTGKQVSKVVSSGKPGGAPRHVVGSKVSNSQPAAKQLSSQSSARLNLSPASEPTKSGSSLLGKQSVANATKQGSSGNMLKEEKSASGLKGMSSMPPPATPGSLKRSPPAGPAATLKDEEVAMLLHQELNSSPRVPRVPRARLSSSGIQGISSGQPVIAPAKRVITGATIQGLHRDVAPRKRLRDDRYRDLGRTSSSVSDDNSKASGTVRKHEDSIRVEDGHHMASGPVESGNSKEKSSHLDSSCRAYHGFPKSSLSIVVPARSDDSSDQGDKKSPADGTILTLPGLIDDILSNSGHQLEYEDVCEAVWPYWQKLRKPNGERYAYASHRQAVLDCLRNRSSWSHLVDRGPKTNLGRKKRRTDVAITTESDDDEDVDGGEHVFADDYELGRGVRRSKQTENDKINTDHSERSRVLNVALPEDVPKGKRKARSRRRRPLVATEDGKAQSSGNSTRTKVGNGGTKSGKVVGPGQEEEPDAPSSPSSEDAVSNYSEEDEEMVVHKGIRSSRRRRDGESSDGEEEMD